MIPKKSLGQNFLIDKNIIRKILNEADITNNNIIEIGPGLGALTEYIIEFNPKKLIVIEKDLNLYQKLLKKFDNKKIIILNEDALLFDYSKFMNFNIIANLPGKIDAYSQKEKEIFYKNSLVYKDDLIDSLKNIKLLNIKSILKYYSQSKSQSLQKINSLKLEIKEISKKESQTILFAFLIQVCIFFIIQFFEFGFDFSQLTQKKRKN